MFKRKIINKITYKKSLIKKYYKAFDIVKKYIDNLDLMNLLTSGCPKDVYDLETIDIVVDAIKIREADVLTETILKIFKNAFDEDFNLKRQMIFETSKRIINELKTLNIIEKDTYFISKDLLPGSCYFEFKAGKHEDWKKTKQEENDISSLYLYGDDDGNFDYSAILPFTYLINGSHTNPVIFNYLGITYINKTNGKEIVSRLKDFSLLLGEGKQIFEALEIMRIYNLEVDSCWHEDDRVKNIDLIILKNTVDYLAEWMENTLIKFEWITILGI